MTKALLKSAVCYGKIHADQFRLPEVLRNYQFQCLKQTLKLAQNKIPFYKNRWQEKGIDINAIRSWNDFGQIPLLNKREVREHRPEEFLPDGENQAGFWKTQTTGSTGIPITIYRSAQTDAWNKALLHFSFAAVGISVRDRFCQILHFLPEKPQPSGFAARLGLKRYFPISLKLSEKEILERLSSIRPQVLYSFPSVLVRLAEYAEKEGLDLKLKCLFGQGEILPSLWRERIERAFQAPLYHSYGTTEFPRLGFECRMRQGYHLLPHASVVELLREDGSTAAPGEEGEIVLTALNNFTMPFIRYRIGDTGVLSLKPCPCGMTYPLLQNVTGRMDDFVLLPNNRQISARALTHLEFDGILQHKIIQKSPTLFEVLVIPSASFGEETIRAIEKEIRAGCQNENMEVRVKRVESLPVSRTGKLQLVSREF